jgi:hypothetical protein
MGEGHDLASRVRAAAQSSDLAQAVSAVNQDGGLHFALGSVAVRGLTQEEVAQLERLGNSADDWSRVRVADPFDPKTLRRNSFHGDVVLGSFSKPVRINETIELPSGLSNSTIVNSLVGHDALVRDVHLLANYVIASGVVLANCGSITATGPTAFGNGKELPVGLETGGREVAVYAEIDVETSAQVARWRDDSSRLAQYAEAVSQYVAQVRCDRGIVASGAVVRDTTTVRNSFIGSYARVEGATLLADSTLLSGEKEPVSVQSGACVTQSLLQWGSHVTTMAIVDRSVLTEHSHVERHGKLTDSILGPNSGVAEGEATSCLLGPFVGFHHQALLIAVLWPEGKGNVGYGANVGSNHTGKAPDQEFRPGEGAFLGLGVNIKFPSDFTRAPYSMIASGVSTLPQKITFPFSLINAPFTQHAGISPAYNEIIPAWLLTDNMYTLRRNEGKYKARNKARRSRFTFDVFRPDTVDLMRDAAGRLESVTHVKELYVDSDLEGLGKNYMLEVYRQPAIEAYRFYMRHYALLGLKCRAELLLGTRDRHSVGELLTSPSDEPLWEHQRRILHDEFHMMDVAAALRQLPAMLEKVAGDVEQSKAKDDRRGTKIIDDYGHVHAPAAEDSFVRQTWQETRRLVSELEELIGQL